MQTRLTKEGRAVAKGLLKILAVGVGLTLCGVVLSSVFTGGNEPQVHPAPEPPMPPPAMGLTSPLRSFPVAPPPPADESPPTPQPSIYMYGIGETSTPSEAQPPPPRYFSYGTPLVRRHVEVHRYDWHPPKSKYKEYEREARERQSTYAERSSVKDSDLSRAKRKMDRAVPPIASADRSDQSKREDETKESRK